MKSVVFYYPDEAGKLLPPDRLLLFWMKVDVKGPDECWPWKASGNGLGYGQFHVNNRLQLAHRIAKQDVSGDLGVGKVLRHTCGSRSCCNPDHLKYGTQKDNIHDSIRDGTFKSVDGKLGVMARRSRRAKPA